MKIVRRGCFETNSSSTHSISIAGFGEESSCTCYDTFYDAKGTGVLTVNLDYGQFGWGVEHYDDPMIKLMYLLIDCCYDRRADELIQQVRDVVKVHTGLDLDIQGLENVKDWRGGYIDHQSVGTAVCEIWGPDNPDPADAIKEFVFNLNSTLTIDNDNH